MNNGEKRTTEEKQAFHFWLTRIFKGNQYNVNLSAGGVGGRHVVRNQVINGKVIKHFA